MARTTAVLLVLALLGGCSARTLERQIISPEKFGRYSSSNLDALHGNSPYLMAHMRDGSVYVFSSWKSRGVDAGIEGIAAHLGALRDTLSLGTVALPLDSIALLESNIIGSSGAMAGITLLTTITAATGIFCITNPKACFGSCPTFYVTDGDTLRLAAEGFSASISPALEATDVDAIGRRDGGGPITVRMTNEALETHVVRSVNLLAVPVTGAERVFRDEHGRFWASPSQAAVATAIGPEGDCARLLREADGEERFSLADSTDLGAKESIVLTFPTTPGTAYGLTLTCRQGLLPTYLLYQALAYMGKDAGRWLAEIERGTVDKRSSGMEALIGGIEIAVEEGGRWRSAGSVDEHGPLARDTHLRLLGRAAGATTTVRLTMTSGAWRIDRASLAALAGERAAQRLLPEVVDTAGGRDDDALAALLDPARTLVTQPGALYDIAFPSPGGAASYEVFLESRGYYLEWMRDVWVAEENPRRLLQMMLDPSAALRRMAPEFKRVEPSMEACFWGSRYAKP